VHDRQRPRPGHRAQHGGDQLGHPRLEIGDLPGKLADPVGEHPQGPGQAPVGRVRGDRVHVLNVEHEHRVGPERRAVAARELTKLHETVYRGTLGDLGSQLAADPGADKGEYTLVIAGAPAAAPEQAELDRLLGILLGYLGVRQAAEAAAKIIGVGKNEAYKRALQLREGSDSDY